MTRERAIKILECMAVDLTGALADTKEPLADVLRQRLDAIDVAQAALTPPTQEQMKRVWPGCSFCKNNGFQDYMTAVCVTRWGMSFCKSPEIESDDIFYAQNHFCRFCGRPLTPKAWEELRKRWEALNDGKGD